MSKFLLALLAAVAVWSVGAESPPAPVPTTEAQYRAFFDSLDWSVPGLAKAAAAWKNGDLAETIKLTAKYFRDRDANPEPIRPQAKFNRRRADAAAAGQVEVVNIPHHFTGGNIDWRFNPTKAPGKSVDHEWVWQLNRMGFWPDLGRAYRATGDEKYPRAYVRQLRSWAACWPRPQNSGNYADSGWRTIECGIRLGHTWPQTYQAMLSSPEFTDADLLLYLRMSQEQMRHAMQHRQTGNWLTMEMNGVYNFASTFPEFKESAAARKFAVNTLYQDLQKQFLPDGAQYELSTGYHFVALDNAIALARKAQRSGFAAELPPDYITMLEKGYEYSVKLMTPNFNQPRLNDSWAVGMERLYSRDPAVMFPQNELFKWVATKGKAGKAPAFKSVLLPWAGYIAMRTGWEPDANYLLFDVGPLGKGHYHQDKLNLVLFAGDEELLFDDGGGQYERSKFRNYACSAADHSTVLVDGKGQNRSTRIPANLVAEHPVECRFEPGDQADFAEAVYDQGFGKVDERIARHIRQVLFIKPDLVIVFDRLQPNDRESHRYQARWQVDTTKLENLLPGHPALISRRGKKSDLIVAPLLSRDLEVKWASGQVEPELLGLYISRQDRPFRPAATVLHERSGKGEQLFLTLLMPVRSGAPNPIGAIREVAANRVEVTFQDGRILELTLPGSASGRIGWAWRQRSGK